MSGFRSALYVGHVMHARWRPVKNRFRYPVAFFVFDLDELESLTASLCLFGYGRARPFSLHDRDYAGAAGLGLRESIERFARSEGLALPIARVELLTNARVFGYVFNPVSFFYLYDANDGLLGVVAEINNTYGQRHRYLMDARCRLSGTEGHAFVQDKRFFVSPFIGMNARYHFHFAATHDASGRIATREVRVDEFENGEQFFVARVTAKPRPITDRSLAWMLLRYPLMTAQVITLIHWQALRLDRLGVERFAPPPPSQST